MNIKSAKLAVVAFLMACSVPVLLMNSSASSDTSHELTSTGFGTVENLEASYKAWETEYVANGGDRNLTLSIGPFKGMSTEYVDAKGYVKLNLVDGIVKADIKGLPASEGWDLWIMDDTTGTALPEPGDNVVRVGSLTATDGVATIEAKLGDAAFTDFQPDLVVVTRAGKNPIEDRILLATTSLFHELYWSAQRGEFGVLRNNANAAPAEEEQGLLDKLIAFVSPTASAQIGPIPNPTTSLQLAITRGRNSFFNQTFNGNGRTCGTCHREDESLTITPEFMDDLPNNDPLFVAEFVPALAHNFENPTLMRKFGLILENVDGFDDLPNKFVMRGIPHTLALLPNTLRPALVDGTKGALAGFNPDGSPIIVPGTDPSILERTGWSGDGAPGTGTLREFIQGAITQHYPRTLGRVPGVDFRLATTGEMNDLEAFMKSTGRRADLILLPPPFAKPGTILSLKDPVAARGQQIFTTPGNVPPFFFGSNNGAGKCFLCHSNAGAGDTIEVLIFGQPEPLGNANFNTGVEALPSQPADLVVPPSENPPDGGFGRAPNPVFGGFGDGTFNTPVLVEAADTPPFFHNNSVNSIEAAVAFYQGASFNGSPAGGLANGIVLEGTEVQAIASFLRVINVLENVRSSIDLENRAKNAVSFSQARELLKLSIAELEDAIFVLKCGNLHFDALENLVNALQFDALAADTSDRFFRNLFINEALEEKVRARNKMVN
jgi:hypothetical protein